MPEPLATPSELAEYLRKDEKTLANWRSLDVGPRWRKIHGTIRYDWADVRKWLDSQAAGQSA